MMLVIENSQTGILVVDKSVDGKTIDSVINAWPDSNCGFRAKNGFQGYSLLFK